MVQGSLTRRLCLLRLYLFFSAREPMLACRESCYFEVHVFDVSHVSSRDELRINALNTAEPLCVLYTGTKSIQDISSIQKRRSILILYSSAQLKDIACRTRIHVNWVDALMKSPIQPLQSQFGGSLIPCSDYTADRPALRCLCSAAGWGSRIKAWVLRKE